MSEAPRPEGAMHEQPSPEDIARITTIRAVETAKLLGAGAMHVPGGENGETPRLELRPEQITEIAYKADMRDDATPLEDDRLLDGHLAGHLDALRASRGNGGNTYTDFNGVRLYSEDVGGYDDINPVALKWGDARSRTTRERDERKAREYNSRLEERQKRQSKEG